MFSLFFLALRSNLQSYRSRMSDLIFAILGSLINNSLYVYGIYMLAKMNSGHLINSHIFFITTGLITTSWGMVNLLFGGLIELGLMIESGALESFLGAPKHPLLLIAISKTDISYLADLIQGLSVIIYLGFIMGAVFAVKMLLAAFITLFVLMAILIIGGSLAFFAARGNAISTLFIQTNVSLALFPISMVLHHQEKWLYYLTPLLFSSFLPLHALTHVNFSWFLYFIIGATLFLISAIIFFNFGVKNYKSANFIHLVR